MVFIEYFHLNYKLSFSYVNYVLNAYNSNLYTIS